jgi:branched-chain amino acid transport system permease protein
MNGGLRNAASAPPARAPSGAAPSGPTAAPDPYAGSDAPRWLKFLWSTLSARHVFTLALVLVFPFVATPFFTFQVAAQALVLGLIALSLTFLGGYGGMVSLAQMSVAGMAGYGVAIFGASSTPISLGWPWWLARISAGKTGPAPPASTILKELVNPENPANPGS